MYKKELFLFVLICYNINGLLARDDDEKYTNSTIGDFCSLKPDSNGKCELFSQCKHPTNEFLEKHGDNVDCGYENGERVICCRNERIEKPGLSPTVLNGDKMTNLSELNGAACGFRGIKQCTLSVNCRKFRQFCGFDGIYPYVCCERLKSEPTIIGSPCKMPYGAPGKCQSWYLSNHPTDRYIQFHGINTICGYEDDVKIVCSRTEELEKYAPYSYSSNAIDGAACSLSPYGAKGVCTLMPECRGRNMDKKELNFCGYIGEHPYVCCEKNIISYYTTRRSYTGQPRSTQYNEREVSVPNCRLTSGEPGRCTPLLLCYDATTSHNKTLVYCDENLEIPSVCCKIPPSTSTPKHNHLPTQRTLYTQSYSAEGNTNDKGSSCTLASGKLGRCATITECFESLIVGNPLCPSGLPYICCDISPSSSDTRYYTNNIANVFGIKPTVSGDETLNQNRYILQNRRYKSNSHGRGKSRDKCIEYNRFVYRDSNCENRVKGDDRAALLEYPHMALLGYKVGFIKHWACNGVLISERYVLAAAHCLTLRFYGRVQYVRLGDLDISTDSDGALPQEIEVEYLITHPDYDYATKSNDVGLIRLKENANLNTHVVPACLRTDEIRSYREAYATGWRWNDDNTCDKTVRKVLMSFETENNCVGMSKGLTKDVLCTQPATNNRLPVQCSDDSIGPLQLASRNGNCMYDIIGLAADGNICNNTNKVIFTTLTHYVEWIENIVWS